MIEAETLTPQEREEFMQAIVFGNSAHEALSDKPWGERVEFTCPVCGGKAVAVRSTYNGHIHASCSKCGSGVME